MIERTLANTDRRGVLSVAFAGYFIGAIIAQLAFLCNCLGFWRHSPFSCVTFSVFVCLESEAARSSELCCVDEGQTPRFARLETRIALKALLERFPNLERIRTTPLELKPSSFIYGIKHIPITLR
jgi:hypothetical protein